MGRLAGNQVGTVQLRGIPRLRIERLFLRKVGGGYIFTHRMLLEYFASLPEQK
jgi:hypothetical protein